MDFDDELVVSLQTPDAPPQDSTPAPEQANGNKVGELFYIRPIPEGLRAPSLDALLTLCHAHTLAHGFDVVKKAGCKPTRTISGKKHVVPGGAYYKWHIPCVLAGKTKNTRHMTEDQRVREKRTIKMGCPSRVWAWATERGNPNGPWEIRYGEIDPALHNHPPVDVSTLPNHRRRAREADGVAEAIQQLVSEGLGRREGLERLRAMFPDGLFSGKDFANEMQKYRQQQKQSRPDAQPDDMLPQTQPQPQPSSAHAQPQIQTQSHVQPQQPLPHLQPPIQTATSIDHGFLPNSAYW